MWKFHQAMQGSDDVRGMVARDHDRHRAFRTALADALDVHLALVAAAVGDAARRRTREGGDPALGALLLIL